MPRRLRTSALVTLCLAIVPPMPAADFTAAVKILEERGADCHTGNAKKGGLSMNTRETLLAGADGESVVKPGDAAHSRFIEVLITKDEEDRMPPKGDALTAEQVAALRAWVDAGMPWDKAFVFDKNKRASTAVREVKRLVDMKRMIDGPIAQLVLDLESRGLLDRTLIVLASEFSRDMLTEGKPDKPVKGQVAQPDIIEELKFYGMHRHFTAASSVLVFGGGFQRGFLYGKTADERPCATVEKPISITDLHATFYEAMGVPADHGLRVEERPFYVTADGHGKAHRELFG